MKSTIHLSRRLLAGLFPVLALGLLLFSPNLAREGASRGLLLWYQVILPTLAPFMICTQAVVALGGVELLMAPVRPFFNSLFGLSPSGSYVLLCGLLCGCPLGAKLCADFKRRGTISAREAKVLLAICNHPSPMFLLGYVRSQLPVPVSPVLLLTCLYLPVLPLSVLARKIYGYETSGPARAVDGYQKAKDNTYIASNDSQRSESSARKMPDNRHKIRIHAQEAANRGQKSPTPRPSFDTILLSTCETLVLIGGYLMLFSILAVWIGQLTFLPPRFQAVLAGLTEITSGVSHICRVFPLSDGPGMAAHPVLEILRHDPLPAVIATVALGGFSGLAQTKSVMKNAGLSVRHYLGWKILHATLSCVILGVLRMPLLLP